MAADKKKTDSEKEKEGLKETKEQVEETLTEGTIDRKKKEKDNSK